MLKNYFLWVGLSVLGLTGCSRSERTPATTGAPAATSSAPPAAEPAATAASGLPLADTVTPSAATTSAEATRLLALLDGPRRRSATTLAAATPDTLAEAGPDSVGTAELRRFLLTGLPPAQVFTVRPGRDTLLLGAQGTQVLVPAHAWDLPGSTAEVRLEMREFYTPADIILAGLSTTAGPQLLETGGMLHLTATANGQPVTLLPGRPVLLRFPARQAQPDMQLFEGVVHGHGQAPDWQLPVAPHTPKVARWHRRGVMRPIGRKSKEPRDSLYIPRPSTQWPKEGNFQRNIIAQVRRQFPSLKRLRRSHYNSELEQNILRRLSKTYEQRIVRQVGLRFVVDSLGKVGAIEPMPGSDLEMSPIAVAALRQLPPWPPTKIPYFGAGQTHTDSVAAQGRITVMFGKSGKLLVTSPSWVIAPVSQPHAKQRQHEVEALLASPALRRRYLHQEDSVATVLRTKEQAQLQAFWAKELLRRQAELARLRTQFTDTSRAAITQEGVYNELWAQGLNWINCDRFGRMQSPITYQVRIAHRDAIVNLVFQEMNSVLNSNSFFRDGSVFFSSVPGGQWVTVVALRRENGVTYLAKQLVQLSETPLTDLRFHPVTMAQLRAELAPAP